MKEVYHTFLNERSGKQIADFGFNNPHLHNVVYVLTIGKAKYVGSSINIRGRMMQHFSLLYHHKHNSQLLQMEYDRGKKIAITILEYDISPNDLLCREQYFIDKIRPNCNTKRAKVEDDYSKAIISLHIDKDLVSVLDTQTNRNRFINDAVREKAKKEKLL